MHYQEFVSVYEALSKTTKKLEKARILADFLPKLKGHEEWVYLLRGRVFPEYDSREFGVSSQISLKALAKASGQGSEQVTQLFKRMGDYGDVAVELLKGKKQSSLFSKRLEVDHVFTSLQKLATIEGDGSIDRKISLIVELLISATQHEARYLIRTLLADLRVGVADAILVDSIVQGFYPDSPKMGEKVSHAYDLTNDFAVVLKRALAKDDFENVTLSPGKPIKVMLAVKATSIAESFEVCGKPAALEHKYDGFRVVISNDGKEIKLFTRRLEDVTKQFPDIVRFARENIKAKNFIIDTEAVGYDPAKGVYLPFESVSQRIRRKYDIEEMVKKLPVEVNVFDILYLEGKQVIDLSFIERRKLIERIVKEEEWKIRPATQIITDNEEVANKFYKEALKIGEEGIMVKKLQAPYNPGRSVGYMVKMKPEARDLDLVIVGGEYGTGKRAGGLTSFILAVKKNGEFVEVGRVSSGLKEKEDVGGTSYTELDKILQPLIISEDGGVVRVKPKVIVSVTYQNIQPSPSYSSGYALRFPRITHYRPERGTLDIATLEDIKKEFLKSVRKRKG